MTDAPKHTPGPDMLPVSKERFYQVLGPTDVHPRTDLPSLKGRHHRSDWETPYRVRQGVSISDGWGIEPTAYFLRAAIAKAEGR